MSSKRDLGRSVNEIRSFGERKSFTNVVVSRPIGIKTPLEKGSLPNETLFKMHFEIVDQIKDNLKNLIMTQKGERLGYPDFGTNLRAIYSNSDLTEDQIAEYASQNIKSAVQKFMPNIALIEFYSSEIESTNLKLFVINRRISELKNKSQSTTNRIGSLTTAESLELRNLESIINSGIGQSNIAGFGNKKDFLQKQGSTQVSGDSKSKVLNKSNPNKDKIYKVTVDYNIPLLNNKEDSIILFINSGI